MATKKRVVRKKDWQIDRFLRRLRALNKKWSLVGARIRYFESAPWKPLTTCPIVCVGGGKGSNADMVYLGLGLTTRQCNRLVDAADYKSRRVLRTRLLRACGLTEVQS